MELKRRRAFKLPLTTLDDRSFVVPLARAHRSLESFNQSLNEGSPVVLNKEIASFIHSKDPQKIQACSQVYKAAVERIIRGGFSFSLLCQLHRSIGIKTSYPHKDVGKFRARQNWIGPEGCSREEAYFYPPDVVEMRAAMKELKAYFYYKEKDPLVHLAIFVGQFLIIHPFMDGNGRVIRMLIPLFLYKKGLIAKPLFFMNSYLKKHREEYFALLNALTEKEGWEKWILFFLKGIEESTKKTAPLKIKGA